METMQALRKLLWHKLNVAEYEAQLLKKAIAEIDGEGTATEAPEAPAKKPAPAKEATPPKAENKKAPAPKKAPAKQEPEEDDLDEAGDEATEGGGGEDDDFFADDTEETKVTIADVRTVVKQFAKKFGKPKAMQLLSKFGVTSIPAIKPADFEKVIALANKHLKK